MKELRPFILFSIFVVIFSSEISAQGKIGYISFVELISLMPESKLADSTLKDFQHALIDDYQKYKADFDRDNADLNSTNALKYNKGELEVKRLNLEQLYQKLQNFQEDAYQRLQKMEQDLKKPIEQKALDAIKNVAKKNGYTYVFIKERLGAYPGADDLLPRVKTDLGIK